MCRRDFICERLGWRMRMRRPTRRRRRRREGGRRGQRVASAPTKVIVPRLHLNRCVCAKVSMATCVRALVSVYVVACAASNIDTRFPLLKTGADGTLFGLSVALHIDLKSRTHLEWAEPGVPANRTGGVYICPITSDQSDCRRLPFIKPDLEPSEDLVEDMWLGVTLASQGPPGGQVLACGHRFVKIYGAFKLRHMIGRCYLRGNDLRHTEADEQVCSHLGDMRGEVMCNSGMSAAIFRHDIIIGSPGSYQWQGNIHVRWNNPDDVFDTRSSSFPNLQRRNIYLGYSVTQAEGLLSQDDITIVTGAPKDTKEDARGSVMLAVKVGGSGLLAIRQTLRGEQTGSYFGNAVAAADLDNDGWCDLLVGAPFYFRRQQEVGGAVYVYMNVRGHFLSRPTLVLKGPPASAFGMAVAHAGDLDQDGFQDFAVGAPFQGTGSVMIWRGSSTGISTQPSQVISGSSLSPRFSTFGFSLSAGLDVDGNKHPDLLIGSLDDTTVLLRTRPVIHLNKTIRVSPNRVDPNTCDFCIEVEVCFSYIRSTGETRNQDSITIHFTVAADVSSLNPRLHFRGNGQSMYAGFMLVRQHRCRTLSVGLLTPVRDKMEALVFSLNASLHQKISRNKDPLQDLAAFPVLSHRPRPVQTQVHIQKYCGSDNRCHSNLQMAAHFTDSRQQPLRICSGRQVWFYEGSADRLLLRVNISNTAEDAHLAILNVSVPPALVYSGVRTKGGVQEVQCSVEGSVVLCELGNPFKANRTVEVWIILEPSEISWDTREVEVLLQMSTLSEQTDLSPVWVSLTVNYTVDMSLTLTSQPGPAPFSGHVLGESAMRTTEDVGPLLLFTFQVHVGGRPPDRRGNLELAFEWPSELSNGKWLLYLTEISLNGSAESRCLPPGNVLNPLRLKLSRDESRGRERQSPRQYDDVRKDERAGRSPPHSNKSYILDCRNGGAKCVHFVCRLSHVKKSASVTLRARLWKATMLEHYMDARAVLLRGQATLRLGTISTETPSAQMEVYAYPDVERREGSGAPLWTIVAAVLGGLGLLALICMLLWKCGFFLRHRSWRAAAQHQGRILAAEERHEGQDAVLTTTRSKPKQWRTWTAVD
ncbi:integrin alpha-3-like isoform X2 [Hippocampus zosterae]|uniref:integrin alpha-3-like isoform X2 n=1 Tax=Hippocampus zosterae TaxID=109293 RepID=UPI00223D2692|nr:integrin alpha-3-like isoform X2 [Hippocampus zosterae]